MFKELLFFLFGNTFIRIKEWIKSQRINKLILISGVQNQVEFLAEVARIVNNVE